MNRPALRKYVNPQFLSDLPEGPCYDAGHLVTVNAGWRTRKPVLDSEACTGCYICYMNCPEGVIFKSDDKVDIDYDFCKGCGICANGCPKDAIVMIREGEA
ncbi:4Fe-4S binding protein [Paenibacillus sp. URB8-2]|uniref:4Fe-4S binding protein n=1 Tax=Paenibacillus sp. URB8-2 TaxID=2741301 RepID=UPI0015BA5C02|nr:4Fe-4S binding protein [Paenibacillus sp. URB8-2]BCG59113.1 2-ketoisovalerate ferredoxin oxidoreductase subunit delta [Paenibacillus sp. URB8-2]